MLGQNQHKLRLAQVVQVSGAVFGAGANTATDGVGGQGPCGAVLAGPQLTELQVCINVVCYR